MHWKRPESWVGLMREDQMGYYMEYPTYEDVLHYIRDLSFEDRISLMNQGYHRGVDMVHCYNMEEFVMAIGKREFDNPAGGVRELDREKLIPWLRDVIGDAALADKAEMAFETGRSMSETVDTIRTIVYVRMNQYNEIYAEGQEREQKIVQNK